MFKTAGYILYVISVIVLGYGAFCLASAQFMAAWVLMLLAFAGICIADICMDKHDDCVVSMNNIPEDGEDWSTMYEDEDCGGN